MYFLVTYFETVISCVVTGTGAVYLKNMILHHWMSCGDTAAAVAAAEFVIHDSDKNVIRDNIVDAVIVSESLIRLARLI